MGSAPSKPNRPTLKVVLSVLAALAAAQGCAEHQARPGLTPTQELVLHRDMSTCMLPDGTPRERALIYTVFLSRGFAGPGAGVNPELFTTNDKLLEQLKHECPGVQFIARDVTKEETRLASVVDELKERKQELDGILLIGVGAGGGPSRDYSLAFSGLPTIAVYNLYEFMNFPHKEFAGEQAAESVTVGEADYQDGKVLTAQLDRRSLSDPSVSAAMFRDLVYKIRLIEVIAKLKSSRVLVVSPYQLLSQVDYQGDAHKHLPKDYNERYTRALKDSLGVELVIVPPQEFFEAYEQSDVEEAERISEEWISLARGVTAARPEITKNARAYLAFEALRNKYKCNAVSTFMRRLKPTRDVADRFWPGLGLECGFKRRGIQAVCQNYPNIVAAQLLGYFLTGRPSMLGDLIVDPANNTTILTHCGAPVNPYGDNRIVDYVITTHAQSPLRDTHKPGSATGLKVEWPAGEPVTIWKLYALHKKIGLYTGEVVGARDVYDPDRIDSILCRTKLVTRVQDAQTIQKHFSPDDYGIHRAATLGDLRHVIKDVAVLLGYDVVEEDR